MASRFDKEPKAQGPVVQGFSGGGFSVDGNVYRGLFLTPESAREWDAPALHSLMVGHLEPLIALDPAPEFVLLGTGPKLRFPARSLIQALEDRGIGLEVMDSKAAARTWGLLRGEERWIAAALMPIA
ncbi:MAG TPA: MTH938/NDUFAF3 family protein [Allosphingosinicella sp.]